MLRKFSDAMNSKLLIEEEKFLSNKRQSKICPN